MIDLTGQKFGRLTVIELSKEKKGKRLIWECVCDCGTKLSVTGCNLTTGHTKSCGCYKRDRTAETKTIHAMSSNRLFYIWSGMHSRCYNPNNSSYKDYGARGIVVCPEWHDFMAFAEWAYKEKYAENLTIERIDVNDSYSPGNCCWATMKEQANNKTNNFYIFYNGETKTLAQWAEELDLPYKTLYHRLKGMRWTVKDAFERPIGNNGGKQKVYHNKGTH